MTTFRKSVPKPIPPVVSKPTVQPKVSAPTSKPIQSEAPAPMIAVVKNALANATKGMPITASVPESKPKFQQMDDTIGIGKPITLAPEKRPTDAMPPLAAKPATPMMKLGIGTMRSPFAKTGTGPQYLKKGGKINLDACSVSTHQKSKKSSSW
jgi:hypothetical protein